MGSVADELLKLKELLDCEAITKSEFDLLKADIINGVNSTAISGSKTDTEISDDGSSDTEFMAMELMREMDDAEGSLIVANDTEKRFRIAGHIIVCKSGNDEAFAPYFGMYLTLARESQSELRRKYEGSSSFKEAIINVSDKANSIIDKAVDEALRILHNCGVNYSKNSFMSENYYREISYDHICENAAEKYLEIVNANAELKKMREIERASRSRWVGGGFGVKGAIKGAVTAGVMNMGTGLVRSIGDSMQNSSDEANYNKKLNQLYNDANSKNELCNPIYNSIMQIFLALKDKLVELNIIDPTQFTMDYESAINLFNNTIKYSGDDRNKLVSDVVECIRLFPGEKRFYNKILATIKEDFDKNFDDVNADGFYYDFLSYWGCDYFGTDNMYISNAGRIEKDLKKICKDMDSMDAEQLLQVKETIKQYSCNGIDSDDIKLSYIKAIESRLDDIDREERTFDGYLYNSVDDRIAAEKLDNEICILCEGFEIKNKEELLQIKDRISKEISECENNDQIRAKYTTRIDERLHSIDIEERTYGEYIYDTVEAKENAIFVENQLKEICSNLALLNSKQLREIKDRIYAINNDGENVDALKLTYIEQIDTYLSEKDLKERTYNSYVYKTVENKEYAEKIEAKIKGLCENLDSREREQLLVIKETIERFDDGENILSIKEPYIKKVEDSLDIVNLKCTYKGYCYKNEANKDYAQKVDAEISDLITDLYKMDKPQLEKIMGDIDEFADGENIDKIKESYKTRISQRLFVLNQTTVDNKPTGSTIRFVTSFMASGIRVFGEYDNETGIIEKINQVCPKYTMSGEYVLYVSNSMKPGIVVTANNITIQGRPVLINDIKEVLVYDQDPSLHYREEIVILYYRNNTKEVFKFNYEAEMSEELKMLSIVLNAAIGNDPKLNRTLYSYQLLPDSICMTCGQHSVGKTFGVGGFKCNMCGTRDSSKLFYSIFKRDDILRVKNRIKKEYEKYDAINPLRVETKNKAKKQCPQCARMVAENAKFCNYCGQRM